jgi:hypothetical protein
MLTKKGELTDIGSWYLGGQATNTPDWMMLGWQFLAVSFLFGLCVGG